MSFPEPLKQALSKREELGLLRKLSVAEGLIDFCSNDYLGFARSEELKKLIGEKLQNFGEANGSTGSRLISGNSKAIEELEIKIAGYHQAEASLVFNSGYSANLGLLSAIGKKGDVFLYDELVHASLHDGMRLSHAAYYKFKHNNVDDLKRLLESNKDASAIYVIIESVYSMDGDLAPLQQIAALKNDFQFYLIVDEAHAIGIFGANGSGLCSAEKVEESCFARIYTYGKAMGIHGASVAGSKELRDYLINFSRPFIYTTALSPHAYASVEAAYAYLGTQTAMPLLKHNIEYFSSRVKGKNVMSTPSAIQVILIPGNAEVSRASEMLRQNGFDVRAIKSPTVKAGTERLRICLHAYNTENEMSTLAKLLNENNCIA